LQHPQHQFALRFNNDSRQQRDQRSILDHPQPAFAIGSLLGVGQRLDGLLPGAGGDAVVSASEVGFGDLEIQHGLAFGLVLGFDNLAGLVLAAGAQAGALAGHTVNAVEASATNAATNQTVACFHTVSHATAKINEAESELLAVSRRITPDYAGYPRIGKLVSVLVSVWTLRLLNPL